MKGHKFCYQVRFRRAGIDEKTGAPSYSLILFFRAYYDEDGDGKFESLVINEKSDYGPNLYGAIAHIPQWVLDK